jgi:hypothetical protein
VQLAGRQGLESVGDGHGAGGGNNGCRGAKVTRGGRIVQEPAVARAS